jgi:sugar lactone lactonase YvrE
LLVAIGLLTGRFAGAQGIAITSQPANQVVIVTGTASINVGVSGSGPFAYQWLHDGSPVLVTPAIFTVAGTGASGYNGDNQPATNASLYGPRGMGWDRAGNLYFAELTGLRIRRVATNGIITTIAGTGAWGYSGENVPAAGNTLVEIVGVMLDPHDNIYLGDEGDSRVRKISTNGLTSTVAGLGSEGYNGDNQPATSASLNWPFHEALDAGGNLYIGDMYNYRIRKVSTNGIITTVVGVGSQGFNGDNLPATNALIDYPVDLCLDAAGNIYFTDYGNQRIRKVSTNGIITTVAGNGNAGYNGDNQPATNAWLNYPNGIAISPAGDLYICELGNQRIRKVSAAGIITTVAGNGNTGYNGDNQPATNAWLNSPTCVRLDSAGSVFISDGKNQRIRKVVVPRAFLSGGNLILPGVTGADTGSYQVVISNASGSVTSSAAILTAVNLNIQPVPGTPVLQIYGPTGETYRVDYSGDLSIPNNWTILTNLVLPGSPYLLADPTPAHQPQRFYRLVPQ